MPFVGVEGEAAPAPLSTPTSRSGLYFRSKWASGGVGNDGNGGNDCRGGGNDPARDAKSGRGGFFGSGGGGMAMVSVVEAKAPVVTAGMLCCQR